MCRTFILLLLVIVTAEGNGKVTVIKVFKCRPNACESYKSGYILSTGWSKRYVAVKKREIGKGKCSYGWILWRNTCYLFSDIKETWPNAQVHCRSLFGSLVEIPNVETNTFIKDHLKSIHYEDHNHEYYFGASDVASEGNWVWVETGVGLGYNDWGSNNQPSGGRNENCAALDGTDKFNWHDYPCGDKHRFICGKENAK